MIILLTGQPGNGKTSKIINEIRKDLAAGRTVYTVGIPKLKLPVIQISRAQVIKWHEKTLKKDQIVEMGEEPVYELDYIVEGSKIYVDEAQKGFEPSGVKVPEHISFLSEHRHHGLDFVFISQYPFLIHQTIRALITKHWHIRSTWKGRKLHEWPEWQERPQSQTALALSASESYEIDVSTFAEYESASIHTVVKHKRPIYVYFVMASFLLLPIALYFSFARIYAKTQKSPETAAIVKAKTNESAIKSSNNIIKVSGPVNTVSQIEKPVFENVQIVSTQYDWSTIGACVSSKNKCTCYGDEGNKLAVPDSVCKAAVGYGWSGRSKPVASKDEQVYPARDVDRDFTNSVGIGSRGSPSNAPAT